MRILQVSTADRGGGAEGSARNLHRYYLSQGHESWIAVGKRTSEEEGVIQIPNHEQRSGWERFWARSADKCWQYKGTASGYFGSLFMAIGDPRTWLARQLGHEVFHFPGTGKLLDLVPQTPDIIHCHNLHGGYFDLRVLPWLSHTVPVILNLRDAWLLAGHCAHSLDCDHWLTGCGRCPYPDIPYPIKRDGTAYNWKRKAGIYQRSRLYITAPSSWMIDKAKRSMLKGASFKVIPNAVDLRDFHPGNRMEARQRLDLPRDRKILLFAANNLPYNVWKDFETTRIALELLSQKEPAGNIMLIALGARYLEKPMWDGSVLFVPFVDDPQIAADYYRAADLYVHAAKDEVFGKSIVEALACRIPVVATKTGGIPEVLTHERSGLLVPPGNPQSMAEAVTRILSDEKFKVEMGKEGRAEVEKRFGLDVQGSSFLQWYREVTDDWNAAKREQGN